jgi:hypothetical protein
VPNSTRLAIIASGEAAAKESTSIVVSPNFAITGFSLQSSYEQ